MINPIKNNLNLLVHETSKDNKANIDSTSFIDLLKESIKKTNQLQQEANQITRDFALGKIDDVHQVTIATEKAQLALNLTISIQNKVVEAYKEIMRMQI
jgi:flagellar hook-basal body complex protein FliE